MRSSRLFRKALVGLPVVGAFLLAYILVRWAESGPYPQDKHGVAKNTQSRNGQLLLAGSGTALPLAKELADAYSKTRPHLNLVVAPSIGSRGAIAALKANAIDVALLAKPFIPDKRWLAVRCAEVAVVFATSTQVKDNTISAKQILDAFSGKTTYWSDGTRILPLLREIGDSGQTLVAKQWPGFGLALKEAWKNKHVDVLFSDARMQQALLTEPGSIGVFTLGAITTQATNLKALSFRKIGNQQAKTFRRPIWFLARPKAHTATSFLNFCNSKAAQTIIHDSGYLLPHPL